MKFLLEGFVERTSWHRVERRAATSTGVAAVVFCVAALLSACGDAWAKPWGRPP